MGTGSLDQETVRCDVCDRCTRTPGYGNQFGVLHARWGYGAQHDGDRYQVRLCESCFFLALAHLRQERRVQHLFDGGSVHDDQDFGLVGRNDYWGDG